jgi:hypothetical protein
MTELLTDTDCECKRLPNIFNTERIFNGLKNRVKIVDIKNNWIKLGRCSVCGQFWQLDEWDKYQTICAIKINDPANWQTFDDEPDRVQLLINSRGGLSDKECVKANCRDTALKSLAYCPKHAYEIGLRE